MKLQQLKFKLISLKAFICYLNRFHELILRSVFILTVGLGIPVSFFCLFILFTQANADTVHLNKQQLSETREEIQQQGKNAIAAMPAIRQELVNIKLGNLDLSDTQAQIKQSQAEFKHIKPLSVQLESGSQYYLYSESLVSDSKQALASYSNHPPLDINQTISDYNAMLKNAKTQLADSRLLIFISSSMPKRAIINLMTEASPLGAVFVIRGLINGSYVKTYRYFFELKGENSVGIMINPTLFKAFDVNLAPTFALYQSSQNLLQTACKVAPTYTKVTGQVSIHYALEQLKQSKIANLAQIAANELDILDHNNFYERDSSAKTPKR